MSDIVERLRVRHECTAGYTRDIYAPSDQDLDLEAADEIYLLSAALKAVTADRDRLRGYWHEAQTLANGLRADRDRLREDLRCARAALTDWHEAHDKVRDDRDRLREALDAAERREDNARCINCGSFLFEVVDRAALAAQEPKP